MKWKIKRAGNDDLRQKFLDQTIPQLNKMKLKCPDKHLKWNKKTGHYQPGKIDWGEFYRVIQGQGPCNQQRLQARRRAHREGAWVREASLAYSKKMSKERIVK